jgi:hypothetical protein
LIGAYKNGGSDYRPEGCPDKVNEHDFADKNHGKAVPYGVYDIAGNAGCVSVGIDNDTAQFSVNSIRRWRDVDGACALSRDEPIDDHGGWRWLQRLARAAVQSRTPKPGRRNRPAAPSLALPVSHLEVEQDRAQAVLLHHPDMAR